MDRHVFSIAISNSVWCQKWSCKCPAACRYIVCRGLKPGSDAVREYMFRINLKLNQLKDTERDVTDVVPLSIIKEDTDFYQFMVNSNEA